MHNHVEPGFFKKVTQQESYPLLKVKEENAFFNLPKNIYTAVENLTPKTRKLIIYNRNNNCQESSINHIQEQEIINLNEENVVEIDD
ncbi:8451_t:CDS:2, partial [Racocetra persica]